MGCLNIKKGRGGAKVETKSACLMIRKALVERHSFFCVRRCLIEANPCITIRHCGQSAAEAYHGSIFTPLGDQTRLEREWV